MKPDEEFLESESILDDHSLFSPEESTSESVKPSVQGFKIWWDGWE